MSDAKNRPLRTVKSILETPILDDYRWAKVPHLPCDAVIVDMEDSVGANRKEEARTKVVRVLEDPAFLGGRVLIPRVNGLDTPWGEDDLRAIAGTAADVVLYPKVRSAEELARADVILRDGGSTAELIPIIESAGGVTRLHDIAASGHAQGLFWGPADLALDSGFSHYVNGAVFEEAFHYPRTKLVLTAATFDLPVFGVIFVPDMRDLVKVREEAERALAQGFTGLGTFYPPHIDIINEVFTPSSEQINDARSLVEEYEDFLSRGSAALSKQGKAILVHDYKRACKLLERVP